MTRNFYMPAPAPKSDMVAFLTKSNMFLNASSKAQMNQGSSLNTKRALLNMNCTPIQYLFLTDPSPCYSDGAFTQPYRHSPW